MFSPVRPETTSRYAEALLPVLLYCEAHLSEPLTLVELAERGGFSPHHFHRVFRHVTGENPKEYLRRLRLERAVYRMKVTPDNILAIALESGFSTPETFTRAFIRRFSMSPSQFRKVLREYRNLADLTMGSRTFEGFTDDTPLTLRFDLSRESVAVERTPARHLLFIRHHGYEDLLDDPGGFVGLWDNLFAYADAHGIAYSDQVLVGITHDDPYVTDDPRIRYDACLPIAGPMAPEYPVGYRRMPAELCVTRRHTGGLEEIAKTFAYIGVEWLPAGGYELRPTAPFEVYHFARSGDGRLVQTFAESFVPLERTQQQEGQQ